MKTQRTIVAVISINIFFAVFAFFSWYFITSKIHNIKQTVPLNIDSYAMKIHEKQDIEALKVHTIEMANFSRVEIDAWKEVISAQNKAWRSTVIILSIALAFNIILLFKLKQKIPTNR